MGVRCRGWFAPALLLVPAIVFAQSTREAAIEQQIREKAARIQPYNPGKLEALAVLVESRVHLGTPETTEHQGWYPLFGVLPLRGGLSVGGGYRMPLADRRVFANTALAMSFRGYRQFQAGLDIPRLGGRTTDLQVSARLRDFPAERFYGLGANAAASDRATFRLRDADYVVALTGSPHSWLKTGIDAGYLVVGLQPGTDTRFPSIEQRFPTMVPGLGAQPDFLHARAFIQLSSLDTPGNPRAGGRYTVALGRYAAVGTKLKLRPTETALRPPALAGSFNRIDAEAMHLFPFVDKRRVIALRGIVSIARPDSGEATSGAGRRGPASEERSGVLPCEGIGLNSVLPPGCAGSSPFNEVPFHLMPSLGGADSLRGFGEERFRDRNRLLLGAEYRWEVFAGMDMALFVDAGKVTHRIGDLNLSGLRVSPGIGFRFNTLHGIIATFDVARSREGRRYLLTFGPEW